MRIPRRLAAGRWAAGAGDQIAPGGSFREKADAWLFVASGAALLALKETWTVREAYGWPAVVFWLLIALMASLCVANTLARVHRGTGG